MTERVWFRPIGSCLCGKAGTGHLMNANNKPIGPYCKKCALQKIKDSQPGNLVAEEDSA